MMSELYFTNERQQNEVSIECELRVKVVCETGYIQAYEKAECKHVDSLATCLFLL